MAMFDPVVIEIPRFSLRQSLVPHHSGSGEQAEEPKLSEPAKAEFGIIGHGTKPRSGGSVMNVASVCQRDPDVDVREKE